MDLNEIQDIVRNTEIGTRYHFFPGFGDNMAGVEHMWAQTLTNGAIDIFYGQTKTPGDFVAGTIPTVIALVRVGNDTGNFRFDLEVEYGCVGEVITGNSSSILNEVQAVGTVYMLWATEPLALTAGLRRDDYISVRFRRESDSAQDTVEVDCHGVGFMLTYEGRVK